MPFSPFQVLDSTADSHAHPALMPEPNAYLKVRQAEGLRRLAAISAYPRDWPINLALARDFPDFVQLGLGLHPWALKSLSLAACCEALEKLEGYLERERTQIWAIAECGLDAHSGAAESEQLEIFRKQIALAKRYDLPLVIHCVRAQAALQAELKRIDLPILHHGFSGALDFQQWALKRGHYFGLGRAFLRKTPPKLCPELWARCFYESDDDAPDRRIDFAQLIARLEILKKTNTDKR